MAEYLLDANHISPLVTLSHPLRQRVLQSLEEGDSFSIAVPALTEMLFGISLLSRARQNLQEWERLKFSFNYYDIDRLDAEEAARLQVALRHQGWQLETVDALIATTALRNGLTLLTSDQDFRIISELEQQNWLLS
jgi:tRNA(fMet)-specific endonuclease VapC